MQQNHFEVMLEALMHKMDTMIEIFSPLLDIPYRLRRAEADTEKLNIVMAVVKKVLGEHSREMVAFKADMAQLEADIFMIKNEMADLKLEGAETQTEVARIERKLVDLQTDIPTLKLDIANLKTDVAKLKSDVTMLKARTAHI